MITGLLPRLALLPGPVVETGSRLVVVCAVVTRVGDGLGDGEGNGEGETMGDGDGESGRIS
jgi:hypothetical protein